MTYGWLHLVALVRGVLTLPGILKRARASRGSCLAAAAWLPG
jgi:hypothetical protein